MKDAMGGAVCAQPVCCPLALMAMDAAFEPPSAPRGVNSPSAQLHAAAGNPPPHDDPATCPLSLTSLASCRTKSSPNGPSATTAPRSHRNERVPLPELQISATCPTSLRAKGKGALHLPGAARRVTGKRSGAPGSGWPAAAGAASKRTVNRSERIEDPSERRAEQATFPNPAARAGAGGRGARP